MTILATICLVCLVQIIILIASTQLSEQEYTPEAVLIMTILSVFVITFIAYVSIAIYITFT